jgi:hypothetical protein
MKTSPDITGDLEEFIILELNRRGVPLSKTSELPRLAATWRTITMEIAGALNDAGVGAQNCSLADVSAFCFSLISPFRVQRPFSRDNERSFWFSIDDKPGSFLRTSEGLVVSFIESNIGLTVAASEHGLFIGFAGHPENPGVPATRGT